MDALSVRFLLIHGTIVLLVGILAGIPFWIGIIRGGQSASIRGWRVEHASLIGCGLMMLVVSLASSHLELSPVLGALLRWALAISGYSFALALTVGAATGRRGLMPRSNAFDTLLFIGHALGAVGATVGVCVFLYGLL